MKGWSEWKYEGGREGGKEGVYREEEKEDSSLA